MQTPICDFVNNYAQSDALRLHMPGHKGTSFLGIEPYDITEIDGADSLYEATGIIAESEANASALFGAQTLYSTEGSSLCIRAMLYLAVLHARKNGKKPIIAAGRNAHKAFLSAAALLDFEVLWLYPKDSESYLSCAVDMQNLERRLSKGEETPTAVYLTSPDYLGNIVDIRAIAEVCRNHGVLLLVDNAHGAYLKFLPESQHPIDLGADLCCDSAHKTLPVLTGGAYLHISESAPELFAQQAKNALVMFGSTSPSYLILQSLDLANKYLEEGYAERLSRFVLQVQQCKKRLLAHGYCLKGDESLKLTIDTKAYGYEGGAFAVRLRELHIVCEFADPDFVVLMLTPETGEEGLRQMEEALLSIPQCPALLEKPPVFGMPECVMSVRDASFSASEVIPSRESIGRVLAAASVGCPPAVPIVVCGERIDDTAVDSFAYYGIETCNVVKEV
ncbi:MAG: aminotransferase class I/II-fold pyridoxal phosphate-dependent enzyme [Clostridia bacterium]|nr:aminotransferase class I/II-fold pyridoxal phosphate-dependent enzyme [Clostridia bacterium]